MPIDLLSQLDQLSREKRSAYVAEAVAEKFEADRLARIEEELQCLGFAGEENDISAMCEIQKSVVIP